MDSCGKGHSIYEITGNSVDGNEDVFCVVVRSADVKYWLDLSQTRFSAGLVCYKLY